MFAKPGLLAAHRKTHTAGFDTGRPRGFTQADFDARYSGGDRGQDQAQVGREITE